MTAATSVKTTLARILEEGYGSGSWHGPNMKAALADVSPDAAFRRPGQGRHNIAEIAMHHAWCVRSAEQRRLETVIAQLATGQLRSPLGEAERFDLVLGITCHAVYHAGQVQLVKRQAPS